VRAFEQYCQRNKDTFGRLSASEQRTFIDHSVRRDQKLKHHLAGMVIALMTDAEYYVFLEKETELTKRLIQLLVQRLQGALVT
jgi:hypothetical protein